MNPIVVAALYKFVHLDNFREIREPLFNKMFELDVKGTLLLANEGINGTISGTRESIDAILAYLKQDPRLQDIDHKESYLEKHPFHRTKVKLKKEIVTLGVEGIDPNSVVGRYVEPKDWNALISDPDVILVDTRNSYEYDIGTFKGAIDPKTDTFRQFPQYVKDNLDPKKHKKVAMFCTGGIRCEKSTGLLLQQGFEEVYHLKGGILKYLEEVPAEQSLWQGDCYVFDHRVAVNHQLEKSHYDLCWGCGLPITEKDKQSEHYQEGVCCPRCHDSVTEEQKARFAERQKQMELAAAKHYKHIGN
jgi:UPF0176 protein